MPKLRKPIFRRFLEFRLLFVVNAVILVLLSLSFGREFLRNSEINREIQMLEQKAASLDSRNLDLLELNTAFQTESFIEREARLKLGMKKPGENVVVFKKQKAPPFDKASGGRQWEAEDPFDILSGETKRQVANPTKWWYYFFDQDQLD